MRAVSSSSCLNMGIWWHSEYASEKLKIGNPNAPSMLESGYESLGHAFDNCEI